MSELKPCLMTLDEAIEHCHEKAQGCDKCALEHEQLHDWLVELKYARRAEPENNPLTLEELREINGNPVWVVKKSYPSTDKWESGFWYIVPESQTQKILGGYLDYFFFDQKCFEKDYGKTWLAYRQKPVSE